MIELSNLHRLHLIVHKLLKYFYNYIINRIKIDTIIQGLTEEIQKHDEVIRVQVHDKTK